MLLPTVNWELGSQVGYMDAANGVILGRPWRIMPAEKLAEFGTFSGKCHACLVCG